MKKILGIILTVLGIILMVIFAVLCLPEFLVGLITAAFYVVVTIAILFLVLGFVSLICWLLG